MIKKIFLLLQTHFVYFNSSIKRLNNLNIHKILINFNYNLFSFIFFIGQLNIKKSFSFIFFSFLSIFQEPNITLIFFSLFSRVCDLFIPFRGDYSDFDYSDLSALFPYQSWFVSFLRGLMLKLPLACIFRWSWHISTMEAFSHT